MTVEDKRPEKPAYPSRQFFLQLALLIAILLGMALLCTSLGIFGKPAPTTYEILYRVDSAGETAIVRYTQADGTPSEAETVELPWRTSITVPPGFRAEVTAEERSGLDSGGQNDLICEIYLNGKPWQVTEAEDGRAVCQGLVPQ